MIKQLTGTDEAAGGCCLSGLQVLIMSLTDVDLAADNRPGMGEPGGLLSMGSHRVRHD